MGNFKPNAVTISSVLPAFANLGLIRIAKSVHCFWVRGGFEGNVFVETALVDMYSKFGCMGVARQLFESMSERNVVSWNAIVSGYSDHGFSEEAIDLFNLMRRKGLLVDFYTIMSLIPASLSVGCLQVGTGIHGFIIRTGHSGALQQGRRVHALAIKTCFANNIFVGSAVIDMYANCGNLEDAKRFFYGMGEKDVVCWNAMIAGNGMNGYGTDAIDLFLQMKGSGQLDAAYSFINNMPFQPDFDVYSTLLGACRIHGNIKLGHEISQKIFEMEPNDAGYYVSAFKHMPTGSMFSKMEFVLAETMVTVRMLCIYSSGSHLAQENVEKINTKWKGMEEGNMASSPSSPPEGATQVNRTFLCSKIQPAFLGHFSVMFTGKYFVISTLRDCGS
ncbi:Pentatricopeptide repeat-containing protein DOT4, chloroplastic [Vitis vinifera]|uniref:Pentatricopeptide repeat-containing protein DOT4, chloroplastic n=1 Tax=Vitis vinifera TaxID=29760 RepID=A0A438EQ71_VITVI|nr:Pentatricopeptide repeat-containing protein DOT4, chloroplastic [Vitis vinifera]